MTTIRKAKKEMKILKEIKRDVKEVKKEDSRDLGGESEEENENGKFSNGDSANGSSGKRTAPILQAENQNQNLERVAETAPRKKTDDKTPQGNVYSASYNGNYAGKYQNQNYEARREDQIRDRPTIRASGILNDARTVNFNELRRQQNSWNAQDSASMQQRMQDRNAPDAQNYQPREDVLQDQKKLADKRRRMM